MSPDSKSKTPEKAPEESAPSAELMQLLSPDGYYTYLGIPRSNSTITGDSNHTSRDHEATKKTSTTAKPSTSTTEGTTTTTVVEDEELIKKNYRKLSLKHHPDRRGGDAETFRVLNRAQIVLLNPKLRAQYDILGLDLDEDHHHHKDKDEEEEKKQEGEQRGAGPTTPDTIVSHLATSTLAAIMQLGIRTIMMGLVSVFLCRWRITVFPALAFLTFIVFRIYTTAKAAPPNSGASKMDVIPPICIGVGLILLYRGRSLPDVTWSVMFWVGEALVMTMFTYNSIPQTKSPAILVGIAIASLVLALCLRGRFWAYATAIGLEAFVALVAVMAFPIMELVLEEVLKDKLRKVGEKVREHSKRMELYYASQQKQWKKGPGRTKH